MPKIIKQMAYNKAYNEGYKYGQQHGLSDYNQLKSQIGKLTKQVEELKSVEKLVISLSTINDAIAHAITAIKR